MSSQTGERRPSPSLRPILPWIVASLPLSATADVPTADVWHLTGYVFEGASHPPSSEVQPVGGTATLVPKEGSTTTYVLTFDVEGEVESFEMALEGDVLTASSVEDAGGGYSDHWKMNLRIVDENTLLLTDFYATLTTDGLRQVSYDCAGGVLTRAPLPSPASGSWAGNYQPLGALDFTLDDGEPIVRQTDEDLTDLTLVGGGGGSFLLTMADGEEDEAIELVESAGNLAFAENDTEPFVLHEDASWLLTMVRFDDYAYVVRLGNDRVMLVSSGAEIVRLESKLNSYEETYIAWSDLNAGVYHLEGAGGGAPRFTDWMEGLGLEGEDAAPDARPFADGLPNLVRYAMNLGASPAAEDLPVHSVREIDGQSCVTLEFRVRDAMDDVVLEAQESLDPGGAWNTIPESRIEQLQDADPETSRYRVVLPISGEGKGFVRLVASQPG